MLIGVAIVLVILLIFFCNNGSEVIISLLEARKEIGKAKLLAGKRYNEIDLQNAFEAGQRSKEGAIEMNEDNDPFVEYVTTFTYSDWHKDYHKNEN